MEAKVCSNGPGHMTKMAIMPIYGKNPCSQLKKYMNLYEYQRWRSFIDLCPRSLIFNIFKLLFLKHTRLIEAVFHVEPSLDGRMKVNTKWPPCPYMLKSFQNLLLWNRKADELENWYAASSTRVLPNLFKWCPWVDIDLFYGKVKFGYLCFCMGKS